MVTESLTGSLFQGDSRYTILLACTRNKHLHTSGITEAFKADSFGEKINLGVGAYRTLNIALWHFSSNDSFQVMTRGSHMFCLQSEQQKIKSFNHIWTKNMPE